MVDGLLDENVVDGLGKEIMVDRLLWKMLKWCRKILMGVTLRVTDMMIIMHHLMREIMSLKIL